jgi:hypothetical protein
MRGYQEELVLSIDANDHLWNQSVSKSCTLPIFNHSPCAGDGQGQSIAWTLK